MTFRLRVDEKVREGGISLETAAPPGIKVQRLYGFDGFDGLIGSFNQALRFYLPGRGYLGTALGMLLPQ
jgi:hypothetical protein